MATRLQRRAFRKKAKRAAAPQSPEGKARSSQNTRQYGLFARDAVLPGEDPEEFLQLIADLEQELEVGSDFERRLTHHIAATEWRMLRLVRLETGALMGQLEKERFYTHRIQAELGKLNQSVQAGPGEPTQSVQAAHDGENQSLQAGPGEQNAPPPAAAPVARGSERPAAFLPCQQSTKELGAVVAGDRDTPVLLTLSLYESRLTRKYLGLLKQLRLTQKLRRNAEAMKPEQQPGETETRPSAEAMEPEQQPAETEARPPAPEHSQAQHQLTPALEPAGPGAPGIAAPQPPHPPAPSSARASPQEATQEQADKPAPRVASQ